MRKITILTIAAACGGCASSATRLAEPPWRTIDSTTSVAELSGCIMPLVREMGADLQSWPDGDATHYAQMAGPFGETSLIVTVRPTTSGSRAEIRTWSHGRGYQRLVDKMDACR